MEKKTYLGNMKDELILLSKQWGLHLFHSIVEKQIVESLLFRWLSKVYLPDDQEPF